MSRHLNTGQIAALCLLLLFLSACGPADYVPAPDLPHMPTGTVTPWEPLAVPTAPLNRPLDDSVLSGAPCAPPCWYGLVAGVTDADEVRRFLDNSPFVARQERESLADGGEVYRWAWAPAGGAIVPGSNALYLRDGVLQRIVVSPEVALTLSQIVDAYGAPHGIDLPDPGAGAQSQTAHLYYPKQGLVVAIGEVERAPEGDLICPPRLAPVEALIYVPAGEIGVAVAALYDGPEARDATLARLREWDGASCLTAEQDAGVE